MHQLSLFPLPKPVHGGQLVRGKRKSTRPLCSKRPIHLVLKANRHFGENALLVLFCAHRLAPRFDVDVRDSALAVNQVHLLLSIPKRGQYAGYVRALTGLLARKMGKGIWELAPFTRVASWGKDYRGLRAYLEKNRLEAAGILPCQTR